MKKGTLKQQKLTHTYIHTQLCIKHCGSPKRCTKLQLLSASSGQQTEHIAQELRRGGVNNTPGEPWGTRSGASIPFNYSEYNKESTNQWCIPGVDTSFSLVWGWLCQKIHSGQKGGTRTLSFCFPGKFVLLHPREGWGTGGGGGLSLDKPRTSQG